MGIAAVLSLADRNYGYFFGLAVVLVIARENEWDWSLFGFGQALSVRTILIALGLAVLLFVGLGVVETFLQLRFGKIDLSSVDDIRGDFVNYAILMAIMWVFAAFGEELLFRGYYMRETARLLGGSTAAWLASAVLISVYFGISHSYQGTAGAISVGMAGFYSSIIYFANRRNLALVALMHGFYDSIGLTLIYFDKYDAISGWVLYIFGRHPA